MNNKIIGSLLAVILLAGCDYNERNFEGLQEGDKPTDVKSIDYTLTDADYALIADNKTNIAFAKDQETTMPGSIKNLAAIKTNLYISDIAPAKTYLPAFLSEKWFTADNGSSIRVTYNYKEEKSSLLTEYASVKSLKLTDVDYELVYGTNAFAPYLSAKNEGAGISKVLTANFKDAVKGTAVFVDYQKGEGELTKPDFWQTFENEASGDLNEIPGWFISSVGGTQWKITSFDENQYVQYSANGKGECIAWMITPAITATADTHFGFDVKVGYYNAKCLSVLVSENFDGKDPSTATWVDVTSSFAIPTTPTSGYGEFTSAGSASLSAFVGKKVHVAFKYVGDGANKKSTTYQIDNIMVGAQLPANAASTPSYAVKVYDGKNWKDKNVNVLIPTFEDYAEMGQTKRYFAADAPAVNYLPTYLQKTVAYPINEDARVIIYRFYNGKEVKIYSDEYVYSSTTARWELNSRMVTKTEQYVLSDGKWNFDPSVVINLKKGDAYTKEFLQVVVDGVKASKGDEYIDRGNTEYYYGCSAYYGNIEMAPSYWRTMAPYKDKTDAEITALMKEHIEEGGMFIDALKHYYPNTDLVPGIDKVIFTINFDVHLVSGPGVYTIQYVVTGKGTFEYIKDSYKAVS